MPWLTKTMVNPVQTVSLKLVVNKETDKVLFAEVGKDFVDILCSFLTIPLGTIARLIQNDTNIEPLTLGSLNSLYQSVDNFNLSYLITKTCKEMLLYPRNSSEDYCDTLKFNIDDTVDPTRCFFMCSDSVNCKFNLLSSFRNQRCECGNLLCLQVLVKKEKVFNGFAKDSPTFIVTDDLRVLPNSMDTSFDFLKNFGITNSDSVKTMSVIISKKSQILDLLKCSLLSKSSLTNSFIRNKPSLEGTSFTTCDIPNNSSLQIKLKLFFRKTDGEILFAQGEQDFADFLVSFLTFPLGGVVRMLGGDSSLGCIDSLYQSITELDENKYLMTNKVKNKLVDPCIAAQFKSSKQILQIYEPPSSSYYCYYPHDFIDGTRDVTSVTSNISVYNILTYTRLKLVDPKSSNKEAQEAYVKGPSLFMATNGLDLEPITQLNQLETPSSNVTEKVVYIGVKEGLSILKAALTSTSALTNGLSHLLTQAHDEVEESYWMKNWSRFRTYSIALNCISILLLLVVIFWAYI